MNKIIITMLLAFGSMAFATEEVSKSSKQANSNEITVGVKGMVCAFCAQGIEKSFKKQPEVEKIKVSLENKFVQITFKEGKRIPNEKIAAMLKDAGYEASFGDK